MMPALPHLCISFLTNRRVEMVNNIGGMASSLDRDLFHIRREASERGVAWLDYPNHLLCSLFAGPNPTCLTCRESGGSCRDPVALF